MGDERTPEFRGGQEAGPEQQEGGGARAPRLAPAAVRSPAAVRRLVLQRGKKRKKRKDSGDHDDHDDSAHEEATKIKNVQRIQFGKYMIDTWYYSPFPQVRPPPPSRRRAAADGGQLLALCANRSTSDTARSTSASSR